MQKEQLFLKLLRISDLAKPKKTKRKKEEEKCEGVQHIGLSEKIILKILLDEKKLNQRSIARKMKITAQGVSENIKKLIELKYVYKEQGISHNENFILLTEIGEKRAKSVDYEFTKDAETFLGTLTLTQEELLILDLLLNKVFDNYTDEDTR